MKLLKQINFFLVLFPLLIFAFGFMVLLSTSVSLVSNQLLFFVVGFVLFWAVSLIDYTVYRYYWKWLYVFIIILLLITFVFGQRTFGALSWLAIGQYTIQPSEFAKIIIILMSASLIASKENFLKSFKNITYLVLFLVPIISLVMLQPDLGTSLVILVTFFSILFYSGIDKFVFIIIISLGGIFSAPFWDALAPYQKERILVFLNPSLDRLGSGYNVIQSLIAVGSGGFWGKGFGMGTQSHLQFLPVYWTDFVFAAFAEEWGFVGVILLLAFFLGLFISILYISLKTNDFFGSIICIGVFSVFFFQFVINVGMNVGIMPVTGIPLPLVSYGGSSMLTSFILLGLVHSVWIYKRFW